MVTGYIMHIFIFKMVSPGDSTVDDQDGGNGGEMIRMRIILYLTFFFTFDTLFFATI